MNRRALMATLALAALFPAGVLASPQALAQGETERFSLTTHDGRRLSDLDLRGQPYVLFFGFTNCPEVCPTALFELSQVLGELGPQAEHLRVFFVTVDPERDTPDQLATYVSAFDPRIVALRGTEEETARAAGSFRATYRRVPVEGGYTMDHTALIFLVGRDGRHFDHVDYRASHEEQLSRLRRLLAAP